MTTDAAPASALAVAGLVLAASLLTACSAARTGLGTTDESCYLALPTAAKAVGGHGHLEGVRKYTVEQPARVAPPPLRAAGRRRAQEAGRLRGRLHGPLQRGQVSKPLGRPAGTLAVAVVTTPGNKLLGTLILTKLPVRFRHTHSDLLGSARGSALQRRGIDAIRWSGTVS